MKKITKLFSVLLVIAMFAGIVFCVPFTVNSAVIEDNVVGSGLSLEQLKNKFPQGKYWNHTLNGANNPDTYTSTPCPSNHAYVDTCMHFANASQCCGFAKKIAYDAYGSYPPNWSIGSINNVKAGDIIHYSTSSSWGHWVMVINRSGNTLTFGECNYDNRCGISWNRTSTISQIAAKSPTVYVAPSELKNNNDVSQSYWYDSIPCVNLGDIFYAKIKNKYTGSFITMGNKLSDAAYNAIGKEDNGTSEQVWCFIRLNDGSYKILNTLNSWTLDVEAGNNINNLYLQPNGTNVQVYSKYNSTSNQKFFIYNIFDSYYIRPAGTDKVIDLSLSDNAIAIWNYASNFAPQKFDIIRVDLSGNMPTDLGDSFYAYIKNKYTNKLFTEDGVISNSARDVVGKWSNNTDSQLWLFSKNVDGSYTIMNKGSGMFLDVEAGDNIYNLNLQPNGTNIQTYYKNNMTDNQKFYIYEMFNSYYIKPVGITKVVDMGIRNDLVAIWDYSPDFNPQKFEIVKVSLNGNMPIDFGDEFKAIIKNKKTKKVLTTTDMISDIAYDVKGQCFKNKKSQIWNFKKQSDGSYLIQNDKSAWFLDVEAGYNLDYLDKQPDGTNIQCYYKYNGTTNQKFYIYKIFGSYYFKPAGTSKVLDMGLKNDLVAVWSYVDDFDPQKFDILKIGNTGDVNSDGSIDIVDATEIQKHIVNINALSDEQLAVADVNGDGNINVIDATQIQKYIANLISELG